MLLCLMFCYYALVSLLLSSPLCFSLCVSLCYLTCPFPSSRSSPVPDPLVSVSVFSLCSPCTPCQFVLRCTL